MIVKALNSLRPSSGWILDGNDYSNIQWLDDKNKQPTQAEIDAEIARLQAIENANKYQRQRAVEYPPMTDYLDAIVKGDQAQIDKYIADCLAVKAKYPKPTAE